MSSFDPKSSRSIFVVGDDAQSIYGFRGSKVELILNFENTYPNTQEILLNQNYRSVQPILDLAEKILTHNPKQKKKDLFTENNFSGEVSYYKARNDKDEAEFIVRKLQNLYINNQNQKTQQTFQAKDRDIQEPEVEFEPEESSDTSKDPISSMFDFYLSDKKSSMFSFGSSDYSPSSWQVPKTSWKNVDKLNKCAVLYRTHSQSRSIEEVFIKYGLPYKLVSGVKFLDRKEIKDVLAILKFLSNGEDKISLNRFLPLITSGVGPKTLEKIFIYLDDFDYPLAPKFQEMVHGIFGKMQSVWLKHKSLIEMTKDLLINIGYFKYLKDIYPSKEEYESKVENINELYSWMLDYDNETDLDLQEKLTKFLNYISLMTNQDDEGAENEPKISLMSLHQSKGLEYESIFFVGIEDGIIPHHNSLYEPEGFEEEVRLAYVGVTRAEKNLYLISAESRVQFGQIIANPVSRIFRPFIDKHCKKER